MERYVPEIENGYVKLLAVIRVCPICGSKMVEATKEEIACVQRYHIFPAYYKTTLQAQLTSADICFSSNVTDKDGHVICERCAIEQKSTFICALCDKERPSNLVKESFGFGVFAEYLCETCYQTKSAKEWEEKKEELSNQHKYDWE